LSNRKQLLTEQKDELITIGFKGPSSLNEAINKVAEHEGITKSDLMRTILSVSIKKRLNRISHEQNETLRDKLLREISS